jgi:nucleotide-binding universal stress UspA family protein
MARQLVRRVMMVLDEESPAVLVRSWLGRLLEPHGGAVRLLGVLPLSRGVLDEGSVLRTAVPGDEHRLAALARLAGVASSLDSDGVAVDIELRFGEPVSAVVEAALSWRADAVAIVDRMPHSGVTDELLRCSAVAVLLMRPESVDAA